jgi:hypothetical protein
MVDEKALTVETGVEEVVRSFYQRVEGNRSNGNGRMVRNLLEKVLLFQASRLMSLEEKTLTDSELTSLVVNDFVQAIQEIESSQWDNKTVSIGFH